MWSTSNGWGGKRDLLQIRWLSNYFCHRGSSPPTTQCCPRQGKLSYRNFGQWLLQIRISGTNPCKQTLSIGYGGEQISRWFYKARSGECLEFTYGGLGGNENNFLSWEDCNNSCRGVSLCYLVWKWKSCKKSSRSCKYCYLRFKIVSICF